MGTSSRNNFLHIALLLVLSTLANSSDDDFDVQGQSECDFEVQILWSTEISHSPFASAPLITDVNGDGKADIIAAPFTEEVAVIQGEDGKLLQSTRWPHYMSDQSVHSSPLQYDIDGDGNLDVVIITSDGEMLFFMKDGTPITEKTHKLQGILVDRYWYKKVMSLDKNDIHQYILDSPEQKPEGSSVEYLTVDPHVLATPVIADLNRDGIVEEMVIPVSYYLNKEDYSTASHFEKLGNLSQADLVNYLASSLVIFNLTSMEPIRTFHLELTKVDANYPGYILFSPTVIDLDSNGSPLEIIIGTSGGQLHVLNIHGKDRHGFPLVTSTIHGQVSVADINNDGSLEMVFIDTSGNVQCANAAGKIIWEAEISGNSSPGSRIADINNDNIPDVIIPTDDGEIWALRGDNGKSLPGWPRQVGQRLNANVLITSLAGQKNLELVVLSEVGILNIISGDGQCKRAVDLGEKSLVTILSSDVVSHSPGQELLVATTDGLLMCLGVMKSGLGPSARQAAIFEDRSSTHSHRYSWPADVKGGNVFEVSEVGVEVSQESRAVRDVTGSWFPVTFEIYDKSWQQDKGSAYQLHVYLGSTLLTDQKYSKPGVYVISVPTSDRPISGDLVFQLTNQHAQLFQDTFPIRMNVTFRNDLQWLLACPFLVTGVVLLLLHGYPATDFLPFTQTNKER